MKFQTYVNFQKYEINFPSDTYENFPEGIDIHDRKWTVQKIEETEKQTTVAVNFSGILSAFFKHETDKKGVAKTLIMVDEDGIEHGQLKVNIHEPVPCVCACVEPVEQKFKKVTQRVPIGGFRYQHDESVLKKQRKINLKALREELGKISEHNIKTESVKIKLHDQQMKEGFIEENITAKRTRKAVYREPFWYWKDTLERITQESVIDFLNRTYLKTKYVQLGKRKKKSRKDNTNSSIITVVPNNKHHGKHAYSTFA